jgi:carbon starvation protein
MNALPLILFFLAVASLGYRYYSAFLAARVAALDDARVTPAHRFTDGNNYVPHEQVGPLRPSLRGHLGAGPLIGPVLAAQFGFLPGLLWITLGVVFAGATHDFIILASSVRRGGKSLADIARSEISPVAGRDGDGGHPVHRGHRPRRPRHRRGQRPRRVVVGHVSPSP